MKLNITLTIKAPNSKTAEALAMEALAEMTLKAGCPMATGNGDTTAMSAELYKVVIEMEMSNSERLQNAVQELNAKPYIMSAFVLVNAEAKTDPEVKTNPAIARHICHACNNAYIEAENIVNPGKVNEYFLCDECVEDACYNGTVELCEECENYVSDFIENPVTHKKNICPICGNTLWT